MKLLYPSENKQQQRIQNPPSEWKMHRLKEDSKEIGLNFQRKQLAQIKQNQLLMEISKYKEKTVWQQITEGEIKYGNDSEDSISDSDLVVDKNNPITKLKLPREARERRWGFLSSNSPIVEMPILKELKTPNPDINIEIIGTDDYNIQNLVDPQDYDDDRDAGLSPYLSSKRRNSILGKLKNEQMSRKRFIRNIDHCIRKTKF